MHNNAMQRLRTETQWNVIWNMTVLRILCNRLLFFYREDYVTFMST